MLVLSLSNMKKILLTILFTLVLSGGANVGFILENCKNIDTGNKFKNKIFIISDRGEKKILEIDNDQMTTLIIYDLEKYNFDIAEGISNYEGNKIVVDRNKKTVEIEYKSGRIWRYSCSKLK